MIILKKYSGKENTSLGLGYISYSEEIRTIMKGKNLYIITLFNISNAYSFLQIQTETIL
jgi:hypothetical protein